MMSISDILQLVALCALIFFPLGYFVRHWIRPIRSAFRILFIKPRYVKPVGVLRRESFVKADRKHE
ncbi:cellulose biosynthesis protein BcsF [Enterobacter sp. Bisph1]|uniref:cellulose biosynthesis protein BcsF n=1 Tax=Enterobacter sp. Bisph1 TaxID=1274399 RepID=UPI00057C21A3|nr:cellulose biosynthesis protein BcsF [Enterobacter sp. Bisph1]